MGMGCGLYYVAQEHVSGCCEYGNEHYISVKGGEFFYFLSDCYILKEAIE
jgi:hypothetical protein